MKQYFVYLLRCADGTLYCGKTCDIKNRVEEHNMGKRGAKYTHGRRPVRLVYFEKYASQKEALRREYTIKKMRKIEKERLVLATR